MLLEIFYDTFEEGSWRYIFLELLYRRQGIVTLGILKMGVKVFLDLRLMDAIIHLSVFITLSIAKNVESFSAV